MVSMRQVMAITLFIRNVEVVVQATVAVRLHVLEVPDFDAVVEGLAFHESLLNFPVQVDLDISNHY